MGPEGRTERSKQLSQPTPGAAPLPISGYKNNVLVPLLDLKAQYATIQDQIAGAIGRVLESQQFILGEEVKAFEDEVAAYCGTRHAVGCASGSDAILLGLMALGVGPGDEVICPPYTFFSTAGSIVRLGAVPVFADIDPVTYNVDPQEVRAAAARCRRLKAIMPVHLYGQAADLEALLGLGAELGVPIVEDAAQAIGGRDAQGVGVGSRGTLGFFSFFPTKNLGGYGDGGLVTTNDGGLAERIAKLRVHGETSRYHHGFVGLNSRLDALQAAVLRVKLSHLERWHEARHRNADVYDEAFRSAGAATSQSPLTAGGLPLRTPYRPKPPARHIYNQYVIRVGAEIRDDLREHLQEKGVGTAIYYPLPLHRQACFADLGVGEGELPHSEAAARETLALPIYPELTPEQLGHVAQTVIEFVSRPAPVSRTG